MAYTIDIEEDAIITTEPFRRSELDKIAKANGLSKDYLVFPMSEDENKDDGNFYYTVSLKPDYWVHDVAN